MKPKLLISLMSASAAVMLAGCASNGKWTPKILATQAEVDYPQTVAVMKQIKEAAAATGPSPVQLVIDGAMTLGIMGLGALGALTHGHAKANTKLITDLTNNKANKT